METAHDFQVHFKVKTTDRYFATERVISGSTAANKGIITQGSIRSGYFLKGQVDGFVDLVIPLPLLALKYLDVPASYLKQQVLEFKFSCKIECFTLEKKNLRLSKTDVHSS